MMNNRQGGFTLLEVLVVVVIIAVLAAAVTSVIRISPEGKTEQEARRLAELTKLAQQEAVMQSREIALEFTEGGYRFLILDEDWSAMADAVFRPRTLPENVAMDLYIEGEPYVFTTRDEEVSNEEGEEEQLQPRAYILSSGEMTPFEVVLQREGSDVRYHVRAEIGGGLDVEEAR